MEIESANSIADTIHNLYIRATSSTTSFETSLKMAHQLVALFNANELQNPGNLTRQDYLQFMLAHLIVLDTTNAKFLWKRIPELLKLSPDSDSPLELTSLWEIAKALTISDYSKVFQLIE